SDSLKRSWQIDYINASFIPGKSSPREYIASQDPMMGTLVDFWRMVWELGVSNIIMLTKFVENGKLKCERYWPMDEEPLCFGDINVTCFSEEKHSKDWIIRKMQIQHMKSMQRRPIYHFHFLSWPDFGVPASTTLEWFVRLFQGHVLGNGCRPGPFVVHCSAGVGRTGTFIALDMLLQQIEESNYVNVFHLVTEMRKSRMNMIQTEEQYIFIYKCLRSILRERMTSVYYETAPSENGGTDVIYENTEALKY
uniref:receptor-type tyrosine-protein phosphatase H-like n=1 Tax=Myxine glutinosa TaxID=7769 RepID=UPI00358DF266